MQLMTLHRTVSLYAQKGLESLSFPPGMLWAAPGTLPKAAASQSSCVNSVRPAVSGFGSEHSICCISCPGSLIIAMVKTEPGDPEGFLEQAFSRLPTPVVEHLQHSQKSSDLIVKNCSQRPCLLFAVSCHFGEFFFKGIFFPFSWSTILALYLGQQPLGFVCTESGNLSFPSPQANHVQTVLVERC